MTGANIVDLKMMAKYIQFTNVIFIPLFFVTVLRISKKSHLPQESHFQKRVNRTQQALDAETQSDSPSFSRTKMQSLDFHPRSAVITYRRQFPSWRILSSD